MKLLSTYQLVCLLLFLVLARSADFDFVVDDAVDFVTFNASLTLYEQLSQNSLLWGPYRSGYYLGIKPRIPLSLTSGLLWFNADDHNGLQNIRHEYDQHHNMRKANWVQYDPRFGGRQEIVDKDCHINIIIDFVKSENGLNWALKVKAVPHKGYEHVTTSFVWYSGLEGEAMTDQGLSVSGFLKLDNEFNEYGYKDTLEFSGFSKELGLFEMKINDGGKDTKNKHPKPISSLPKNLDPSLTHHLSLRVPDGNVWRGKDIFLTLLEDSINDLMKTMGDKLNEVPPYAGLMMRDMHHYEGNLHLVQKTYKGAAEFDITYNLVDADDSQKITFENLKSQIEITSQKFKKKFDECFHLASKPKKEQKLAKELLSGLLGGLSYSQGDQLVDRETSLDDEDLPVNINGDVHLPKLTGKSEGPHELFSLVPSRPFFPRGFYWDEGFHLLPLLKYDSDLVLEILKSWFELIDNKGWIAREQILGAEARSRVPAEFVVQSDSIVNPPTLLLAFNNLLEMAKQAETSKKNLYSENQKAINLDTDIAIADLSSVVMSHPHLLANYTQEIYPRLKLHYDSFRASQQGEFDDFNRGPNKEVYRWRGRSTTHSLASGLDDYPRILPIDIAELNVDLLCWIGVMTRSMKNIAEILELPLDVAQYDKIEKDITESIESMHWSEEHKAYCDVSVDDDDEKVFGCYKGYISLFPFLTRFIPLDQVDKLGHIVDLLSDPEELASDYGIRSISKSSEFYRTGENYWRSPIWININYLVLDSLTYYHHSLKDEDAGKLKEKIADVYRTLRKQLITNVKRQWMTTGFVWEQYDDITGEPKGAKNFLGWSSLILLAIEMPEKLM